MADARGPDLKGFTPRELEGFMAELGEPRYRGRQVFSWIHKRLVNSFEEMTDLPRELRERLGQVAHISGVECLRALRDEEGTTKYLLGLEDGHAIECVVMLYRHGRSVCVSTQVGCKMGCAMCASGIPGFIRDLSPAEILDQVIFCEREARRLGGMVTHVVFMGSGEPLDNYDSTIKAMRILNSELGLGISFRRITVSTCGIVPGIECLAREGIPVTLSLSLHAPRDDLRERIVPMNRVYPIREVLRACKDYWNLTGRRVSFEYCIIKGVNDSDRDARELGALISGMPCHVNLIPLNPVSEKGFKRPGAERIRGFRDRLSRMGVPVTIRRGLGLGLDAACGQLRRSFVGEERRGGSSCEDRGVS